MITLESAIELARPWATKLIEEKVFPFLFRKGYDFYQKEKNIIRLKYQMSDFLAKTRAQCSTINSLAFPNILKKESEHLVQRGDVFLEELNNVLIIDNAGMGKSTLLKKIVIDIIDHSEYIPIYVELRTLTDQPITEQLNKLIGLDNVSSEGYLGDIPFIYFFDGVDEIPFDIKNDVIKRIKTFTDEVPYSKVIITSRPDQSLLELKSYVRFKIKPLDLNQSFNLIRLYDANSTKLGNSLILSNKLISEIKSMREKDNGAILEFLTTPLYVSLLFCSYKFKPVIPRRKDLFYSQVF